MRPKNLEEFVGQKHLLEKGKLLRNLIENDKISSMIFWGPPGVGKTTLARIIAHHTNSKFVDFSAVTSGIKEIKDSSWKAIYASEDKEYEKIVGEMIKTCKKAGYDDCVKWCVSEAEKRYEAEKVAGNGEIR